MSDKVEEVTAASDSMETREMSAPHQRELFWAGFAAGAANAAIHFSGNTHPSLYQMEQGLDPADRLYLEAIARNKSLPPFQGSKRETEFQALQAILQIIHGEKQTDGIQH